MNTDYDIRVLSLLSIQRALLGSVIPKMKEGWLFVENESITFTIVMDNPLTDEEIETMDCVETELLADLPSTYKVRLDIVDTYIPNKGQEMFFLRKPT